MIFEGFVRKDHFLQASFSTPVSHITVGELIILPGGEYLRRWSVPSLATGRVPLRLHHMKHRPPCPVTPFPNYLERKE